MLPLLNIEHQFRGSGSRHFLMRPEIYSTSRAFHDDSRTEFEKVVCCGLQVRVLVTDIDIAMVQMAIKTWAGTSCARSGLTIYDSALEAFIAENVAFCLMLLVTIDIRG